MPDSGSPIYFLERADRLEVLRRASLPPEKRRAIAALHRVDLRWNLVIPLHLALWLGSAWVAVHSPVLAVDLAAFAVGGLALSTLSVLAHESAHDLLTRNPRWDRLLGIVCGMPLQFCTAAYRVAHSAHHARLRTEDDPDDIENLSKDPRVLRLAYPLLFLMGTYVYLFHVPIEGLRRARGRKRWGIVLDLLLNGGALATAWWLLPAAVMLEGWLFPLLVAAQIANLRGLAEHGMTTAGNEFTDARTVTPGRLPSFLMCNINYHIEHHLYPAVPWYRLPKVHELLRDEYRRAGASWYRSYSEFLLDVARALWRGVVPGRRVVPRAIRRGLAA